MSCQKTLCLAVYDRARTLEYDEMSCLLAIDACLVVWLLSYASVRTRCLDKWSISRFRLVALHMRVYISFDEMSWQTIYMSRSFWLRSISSILVSHAQILTRCLDSDTYLAVCDRFLHARIVLDVRWIISLLIRSHMLWNALIKVLDQKFVSHERRFLYKTWFDLQYFRIDFKMRFTSSARSEDCSARTTFLL